MGRTAAQRSPKLPQNCDFFPLAVSVLASTVSVAAFPVLTETGETLQFGLGSGPVTVQASEIVPENPPCAANVRASVARLPRFTVKVDEAAVIAKSEARLNVAFTDWLEFKVMTQLFGSNP